MRVPGAEYWPVRIHLISTICVLLLLQPMLRGQASYQAQVRGVVSDATGAVVANATVSITCFAHCEDRQFRAITSCLPREGDSPRLSNCGAEGSSPGSRPVTLNFTLRPAGTFTMIQVTEAAPLRNRNFFGLVFLNAGVSEAAGSGTADNYPAGTDTTVEQLLANSHFHMLPVGLCAKACLLGSNSKLPPVPVRPTDDEYGMSVAPSSRPVP